MLFYDRLKNLVIDAQKSFNQVERELGYPRNALANYRLGKEPSAKRLAEIADYFGVTTEYLMGKGEDYNLKKAELLFDYLSTEKKQVLLDYVQQRIDDLKRQEKNYTPLKVQQYVYCGNQTWTLRTSDAALDVLSEQLPEDYDIVFELLKEEHEHSNSFAQGKLVFIKYTTSIPKKTIYSFVVENHQVAKVLTKDEGGYTLKEYDLTEEEFYGKVVKITDH